MASSEWHALVIGVDRYPAFPSRQLSGCVNDAEAMSRFLLEKVQVPAGRLRRLLSPRMDTAAETRASASNIRAAFATTLAAVSTGDHVVLYCAGHGIRLQREASGAGTHRYYGFVPEDVSRASAGFANLILGREIYAFLRAIERQGATATVIADTCHSGGATRCLDGDEEVAVRSLDLDPLPHEAFDRFIAEHPALRSDRTPASAHEPAVTPFGGYSGGAFVMMTGCRDSETAKEHKEIMLGHDGTPVKVSHGLMTYTLLKELERESPETIRSLRWMDLHDRLRSVVAMRALPLGLGPQTPVLEGRPETPVFGGQWRPFEPGFTLRKDATGRLMVDGGALHGLDVGATVTIHPPDTPDLAAEAGVVAVITSATAAASAVQVEGAAHEIADRSRVRLVRPGPAMVPVVIRIHPEAASLAKVIREQAGAGAGDGRFTIVDDSADRAAHAELRRHPEGWVLINTSPDGVPTIGSPAAITADDVVAYFRSEGAESPAIGAAIARGLARWARYVDARDRRALDDTLMPMLDVRLRSSRVEHQPDDMNVLPVLARDPAQGVYVITDADWLWAEIRIRKPSSLQLQIGWLALSDDGNIIPLWPPQGADNSFEAGDVVYVGRDRELALPLATRADQRVSLWTLKVLACTVPAGAAPLNIWSMEQGSAQDAFAAALAAGAARGGLRTSPTAGTSPEQPAWFAWNFRVAVHATKEMTHDG